MPKCHSCGSADLSHFGEDKRRPGIKAYVCHCEAMTTEDGKELTGYFVIDIPVNKEGFLRES